MLGPKNLGAAGLSYGYIGGEVTRRITMRCLACRQPNHTRHLQYNPATNTQIAGTYGWVCKIFVSVPYLPNRMTR
jgi:hypothetical protein